jgi:hypothetical protein
MNGTNANTGKLLGGLNHVKQSVEDILTTPLNTRVMRRDYGSALFDLIDKPLNSETKLDIIAATAEALSRWETRFILERVVLSQQEGKAILSLFGQYKNNLTQIEVRL